jgi:hypothetical protein
VYKTAAMCLILPLFISAGCAEEDAAPFGDDGSDALKAAGNGEVADPCDDGGMTVEVNGRDIYDMDDPHVGDRWMVRMFCQDELMTGTNVLKFTPPTVAVVDDRITDATFVQAGETTMLLQSGNKQFTHDFSVLPAE